MTMSPYNQDQLEAITLIRQYVGELSREDRSHIKRKIQSYLGFRADVAISKKDCFILFSMIKLEFFGAL